MSAVNEIREINTFTEVVSVRLPLIGYPAPGRYTEINRLPFSLPINMVSLGKPDVKDRAQFHVAGKGSTTGLCPIYIKDIKTAADESAIMSPPMLDRYPDIARTNMESRKSLSIGSFGKKKTNAVPPLSTGKGTHQLVNN